MFLSLKKRLLVAVVILLTATVLLETPWQTPTRQVIGYILENPWSWENCAAIVSVCLP